MAEWLGHLMAGWPTWLIGATVVVILISSGIWIWWSEAAFFSPIANPTINGRRKGRHGKK